MHNACEGTPGPHGRQYPKLAKMIIEQTDGAAINYYEMHGDYAGSDAQGGQVRGTPLMIAIDGITRGGVPEESSVKLIELLLDWGADLEKLSEDKRKCLLDVVLVAKKAEVMKRCLMAAAATKGSKVNSEIVQQLIKRQYDINDPVSEDDTALTIACRATNAEVALVLLENDASIQKLSASSVHAGRLMLHYLAHNNMDPLRDNTRQDELSVRLARLLLEKGITEGDYSIGFRRGRLLFSDKAFSNVLLQAVFVNDTRCLALLLSSGVHCEIPALWQAIIKRKKDAARLILHVPEIRKTLFDAREHEGPTPLEYALETSNSDFISIPEIQTVIESAWELEVGPVVWNGLIWCIFGILIFLSLLAFNPLKFVSMADETGFSETVRDKFAPKIPIDNVEGFWDWNENVLLPSIDDFSISKEKFLSTFLKPHVIFTGHIMISQSRENRKIDICNNDFLDGKINCMKKNTQEFHDLWKYFYWGERFAENDQQDNKNNGQNKLFEENNGQNKLLEEKMAGNETEIVTGEREDDENLTVFLNPQSGCCERKEIIRKLKESNWINGKTKKVIYYHIKEREMGMK